MIYFNILSLMSDIVNACKQVVRQINDYCCSHPKNTEADSKNIFKKVFILDI